LKESVSSEVSNKIIEGWRSIELSSTVLNPDYLKSISLIDAFKENKVDLITEYIRINNIEYADQNKSLGKTSI